MAGNLHYLGGGLVSVSVSETQIAEIQKQLGEVANASTVIRPALNDTARHVRTNLVKLIKDDLNLNSGDIRDRISIRQRATDANLVAIVEIDWKAVPLFDFGARFRQKSGGGVSVTTIRGDGKQVFKHMFQATMQSGHVGDFERVFNAPKVAPTRGRYAGVILKRGRRKGQPMLVQPIKEAFGPPVTTAFELTPGLADKAMDDADDFLQRSIASKIAGKLAGAF